MAAALAASEQASVQVILMERQARVGRKLAATGNGRCNLTNLHANEGGYYGAEPDFVASALNRFDVQDTLTWFRSLGLYTVAEESGRVYPYSDQANSVVDVLRFALAKPNVQLLTGFEVKKVKRVAGGFFVENADEAIFCDRLIIACGGLAGTKLGGSMAGYQLLRSLGHKCTKLRPALVQLKSSWEGCGSLKGVRANCHVQILRDGQIHSQSQGELQFTDYGLSGPVIFEVSRDVCQGSEKWIAKLDFLPQMERDALRAELLRRRGTNWNAEELLTGILHNRLGRILTQSVGIRGTWKIADLREDEIDAVCRAVKKFEAALTETTAMDAAQEPAGGIVTAEFNSDTMESLLVPGLFACGEVLDIDGDCGGYNLQWAWSSGRLAGFHAGGNT